MDLVITTIMPIDGECWIAINAGASGCLLDRRGPYSTAAAAEEAAALLRQRWNARPANLPPPRHGAEAGTWDLLGIVALAQAVRGAPD